MQLRSMLAGRKVLQKDLRNSRRCSFIVKEVTNSERGYIVIKGDTPFDVIYMPYRASEQLISDRYCIYFEPYDTSVQEYEISICDE